MISVILSTENQTFVAVCFRATFIGEAARDATADCGKQNFGFLPFCDLSFVSEVSNRLIYPMARPQVKVNKDAAVVTQSYILRRHVADAEAQRKEACETWPTVEAQSVCSSALHPTCLQHFTAVHEV